MDLDDEELKATRELYNKNKVDEQRKIELKMFLLELEKLVQRYKFIIGGCGCCGSPFIKDLTTDKKYPKRIANDLGYNIEEKKYFICE